MPCSYTQPVNPNLNTQFDTMKFKIDTREKFTVFTPDIENLSDIITEEFFSTALDLLKNDTDNKNVVLNLKNVQEIETDAAERLVKLQQHFYESSASFVICEIQKNIEEKLEDLDLLDLMNVTPTESEASDIVQMEEIERELMDDDNPEFDTN